MSIVKMTVCGYCNFPPQKKEKRKEKDRKKIAL